ncbi:MFS transporter [Pseudonocardia parietis]|uniref:Multidrug efflux pump Tap n=1 Tax=Pseudonocardia parietis TaxID=570936 RepID=A0ABS4VVF8_9PSEU|nr:MFS transporter [Pseudonocardia parietis]MBP2367539.1 MFS family permease [Pseudonocardia parietis]
MTRTPLRASPVLWFVSYGLSLLGSGIAAAVLPLLVLARTGDVLAAGLLATVSAAASVATGLVSGLLVDRVDRRAVAAVCGVLGAASTATLPLVDALWGLDMTWFLVLGVLGAVTRLPGMTAQEALLPVLARLGDPRPGRLDRLVAARENVGNVLVLAGPGVGGLLVALLGPASSVLLVTAATSLLAALTTLAIDPRAGAIEVRGPGPVGGAVRRAVGDLVVSWLFLARSRLVLGATLVSAVLVAIIAAVQTTLMPAYFTAAGLPALTGLTLSALAAGSIAGSALYAALIRRVSRRTWFVIGMAGFGAGFALLGSLAAPWVVLAAAALVGLTNAPVSAVLGVLIIEVTPDAMRGRVLGAQNTLLLAAPALTTAPVAAVASAAGLGTAGALLAGAAVLTALLALIAPAFRALGEVSATDRDIPIRPPAQAP